MWVPPVGFHQWAGVEVPLVPLLDHHVLWLGAPRLVVVALKELCFCCRQLWVALDAGGCPCVDQGVRG